MQKLDSLLTYTRITVTFVQGVRVGLGGAMARFSLDAGIYLNLTEETRWCNTFEKKDINFVQQLLPQTIGI